jgi:hypothetical protein
LVVDYLLRLVVDFLLEVDRLVADFLLEVDHLVVDYQHHVSYDQMD